MSEPQFHPPDSTFVIRMWLEWSLDNPRWRGRVVHLQTGKMAAFQEWEQLIAFLLEQTLGIRK